MIRVCPCLPVEVIACHLAHEGHVQVCVWVNASRHHVATMRIDHMHKCASGRLQGEISVHGQGGGVHGQEKRIDGASGLHGSGGQSQAHAFEQ